MTNQKKVTVFELTRVAEDCRRRLLDLLPMFYRAQLSEESEQHVAKALQHVDKAMQEALWPRVRTENL